MRHDVKGSRLKTSPLVHAINLVSEAVVAGIVDCAGTSVRGNVINVDPTPDKVTLGMKVRLTTYSLGTDDEGVEAVGFGFEPAS